VRRQAVAVVVFVALVAICAAASASAQGSVRLYSAKASFACLKKRPEARSTPPGAIGGKPAPPSGITFIPLGPVRFVGNLPYYGVSGVSGWRGSVMWSTSRPNEALSSTLLTFFDTVAQAKKMYHDFYTKSDPAYRPSFGKAILLKRNAVLDWQPWDTTGGKPRTQLQSIILGCLRTR
jgi:hypothetical protein